MPKRAIVIGRGIATANSVLPTWMPFTAAHERAVGVAVGTEAERSVVEGAVEQAGAIAVERVGERDLGVGQGDAVVGERQLREGG